MKTTSANQARRFILVITALLLPSLSLLPLGGLYLWEHGYLLHWAIAAVTVVGVVFVAQRWLLARPEIGAVSSQASGQSNQLHPTWTEKEKAAWGDVEDIAAKVDPDKLVDADALFDVAHHTMNTVARRLNPTREDALWQFTVPEFLAITERVSQRLSKFVDENIPFGDRLTIAQVLTVYRWRSYADFAEKAYDIWRVLRLANPATAVTHEARERLSKAMLAWGKEHVARRLAETFVQEVGRAAIDLYGGRLKVSRDDVLESRINPTAFAPANAKHYGLALNTLVAGNAVGRIPMATELLLAMRERRADDIAAYVRGDPAATVAPALPAIEVKAQSDQNPDRLDAARLIKDARDKDIIIWLLNASHVPNGGELSALKEISVAAGASPPVLLPVVVDNVVGATSDLAPFAIALRENYTGHVAEPVVVTADPGHHAENESVLWQGLIDSSSEAVRGHFARELEAIRSRSDWPATARKAASAAKTIAKSLVIDRLRRS